MFWYVLDVLDCEGLFLGFLDCEGLFLYAFGMFGVHKHTFFLLKKTHNYPNIQTKQSKICLHHLRGDRGVFSPQILRRLGNGKRDVWTSNKRYTRGFKGMLEGFRYTSKKHPFATPGLRQGPMF